MKTVLQFLSKFHTPLDMNVLIIDDHALVKEGIVKWVKRIDSKANCIFATNARLAISKIHANSPIDLILCDLEFQGEMEQDGFYIVKSILSFEPRIKTIALTNYNSYRVMRKAMASGFLSFLDKGCTFDEFQETFIHVSENGKYESPTMKRLRKKRNQFLREIFSESLYGISDLSPRERELTLLVSQTTDRQILAKAMHVKPYTIDSYFKNVLSKLNLKSRQELSMFSLEFEDEIKNFL